MATASDCHWRTITEQSRPVGVGMLLLGIKNGNAGLYYVNPTGECLEYTSFAIGKRCQSARTYLENNLKGASPKDLDEIVGHALKSLSACMQQSENAELTRENTVLAVVENKSESRLITGDELDKHIEAFKATETKEEELEDKPEEEVQGME